MTRVVAVVPVRVGSTRVTDKGIRPFVDTTLLEKKIASLKMVSGIDDIVVSSDGQNILDIATKNGASTHLREGYYASSGCTGSEFFENLANSIDSDVLVYSPPTSPFISPSTVDKAIEKYNTEECDSVATVHAVKHHMWLDNKPLNYDILNSPNSQDLPDIMRITYGVCVNSNKNVVKYKNVVGIQPFLLEINEIEAVDIDTMLDFRFAEYLFEQGKDNV
jgi:CMP-N-acetylneuraminic acid synthetase